MQFALKLPHRHAKIRDLCGMARNCAESRGLYNLRDRKRIRKLNERVRIQSRGGGRRTAGESRQESCVANEGPAGHHQSLTARRNMRRAALAKANCELPFYRMPLLGLTGWKC